MVDSKSAYFDSYVKHGEIDIGDDAGVFNLGDSFGRGGWGALSLWVDAQAIATVIPAPGAILLGSLGAGLVGFMRRRIL